MPITTPRRTLVVALTAVALLTPSPGAGADPAGKQRRAAPLHAIDVGPAVAMAPGVVVRSNQANSLRLVADEQWAVANVSYLGQDQVGAVRLSEPGFSCITCGILDGGREGSPFPDERRLFVAEPSEGTSDIQFVVITCTPSLVDCQDRTLKPVTLPVDGLAQGAQNREPRVSPDSGHLTWTEVRATGGPVMVLGRLVETPTDYRVVDPYVLNPPYSFGKDAASWVPGTRYYETGGGWLDGGRTLVYRSTSSSMNYDIFELDLATGRRTRVTKDLDYNEIYEGSPDGRLSLYASARGLDRMDVFTQLKRPAFLDTLTFPQLGRISLHNNRRCMNEHWLMDRAGQHGGYAGQPLVTRDGWVIRGSDWFADSRRALISQQPFSPTAGQDVDEGVELRVITVGGARPGRPTPDVDLSTLDYERWAIPYASYQAAASQTISNRRVKGARSGTATITYAGTFAAGMWSVRYRNYSDDGRTVLDGTESLTTPSAPLQATWTADVRATGERPGRMQGLLSITAPARFTGAVRTEVEGRSWRGVPVQDDCPGVRRSQLEVVDTRVTQSGRMQVRVAARVPESARPWPVVGATVTVRGHRAVTGTRGWVVLPRGSGPHSRVRLEAGGFRSWSGRL